MPQMAPIGWLSLFIIFSIAFMMFSMMNYYSILPNSPKSSSSETSSSTSMKWKW